MREKAVKRTPMNLYHINDAVHKKLTALAKQKGVSKWLIAEKILEAGLDVVPKFDAKKWLKAL